MLKSFIMKQLGYTKIYCVESSESGVIAEFTCVRLASNWKDMLRVCGAQTKTWIEWI